MSYRLTTRRAAPWTGEPEEVIAGTLRLSLELEARRFQLRNNPEAFIVGTEAGRFQASFDKLWHELFALAGLKSGRNKGLVWHTTRHEFTSRVVENTKDPLDAQKAARQATSRRPRGTCTLVTVGSGP